MLRPLALGVLVSPVLTQEQKQQQVDANARMLFPGRLLLPLLYVFFFGFNSPTVATRPGRRDGEPARCALYRHVIRVGSAHHIGFTAVAVSTDVRDTGGGTGHHAVLFLFSDLCLFVLCALCCE